MSAGEQAERAAVVAEALSWLRTPYHPGARLKGIGVDCGLLLAEVYERCGLIARVEPGAYAADWNLHRDEEKYLPWVTMNAREISRQEIGPGDAAIYKFARTFAHGAIVVDWPRCVHATFREGIVTLADMDAEEDFKRRQVRFFSPWENRTPPG